MFLGEYFHNLDNKGRVIVPSKFRFKLKEGFIITCGFEKCLVIFPYDEWKNYTDRIYNLPSTDKDVRAFKRLLFSRALEVSLDKAGRVVLPQNLRQYSNLKKEAVINGNFNTVEIWSKESWETYSQETGEKFEEKAQKITEFLS
ncbi:MAG: division/cell wall cluster transcriptional repressor MraZ [Candidatus Muiribacteriota bacterium]